MPGSRPPGAEGLGSHGTTGGHFSGDILLAFTTANAGALGSSFPIERPEVGTLRSLEMVPWGYLDPFYAAVVHCIEEAVLNALVSNETMIGRRGHVRPALPIDQALQRLAPVRP